MQYRERLVISRTKWLRGHSQLSRCCKPKQRCTMSNPNRKTGLGAVRRHPIHPFPARMASDIALEIFSEVGTPLRVLDPMMGSGTVLAVARAQGHRAFGFDIDPLAVLISRVWTTPIAPDQIRSNASLVLHQAKRRFKSLKVRDAYPVQADKETRKFVVYWFDSYVRRQLRTSPIQSKQSQIGTLVTCYGARSQS